MSFYQQILSELASHARPIPYLDGFAGKLGLGAVVVHGQAGGVEAVAARRGGGFIVE